MASVPNRANPLSEYNEIRTSVVRTTDLYNTNTVGAITQTNVLATSGSIILSGFTAGNTIGKYQPVCFFANTGSGIFISGATGVAQGGILGVAAADYTAGQSASVITQGIIPFITTGSGVTINKGAWVVNSLSGSAVKSGSYYMVDNLSTQVATIVTGSGTLGIAVTTGSASVTHGHQFVNVWLRPSLLGSM
jgi:hypothetical protein